jgi:hypothetical protein
MVQQLDIGFQRGGRDEEVGGRNATVRSSSGEVLLEPTHSCQREPGIGTLANEARRSATSSARRELGAKRMSSRITKSHTRNSSACRFADKPDGNVRPAAVANPRP